MMKNASCCLLLSLCLLFSSVVQTSVVSRTMKDAPDPWLFSGEWDLICQNSGYLAGLVDLVESIKGKDRVVALALCTKTSHDTDENIRIELGIAEKELRFLRNSDLKEEEYAIYASPVGGTDLSKLRLAQYPRPFTRYDFRCAEDFLITGIETFGKAKKVLRGFPIVLSKGIKFLCSKFENGVVVEKSEVMVSKQTASWGGINFGRLQCPEGEAARGIGQIWEGDATNHRQAMTLHCLPVEQ